MEGKTYQSVGQPVRKKDAMQLVTGQPVYMDDVIPQDCLIVKLLRSPHANAIVKNIDTSRAMLVPGMEVIYTWKDVDQNALLLTVAKIREFLGSLYLKVVIVLSVLSAAIYGLWLLLMSALPVMLLRFLRAKTKNASIRR